MKRKIKKKTTSKRYACGGSVITKLFCVTRFHITDDEIMFLEIVLKGFCVFFVVSFCSPVFDLDKTSVQRPEIKSKIPGTLGVRLLLYSRHRGK